MTPDFLIHPPASSRPDVVYIVTPQNSRALCWMIARTSPSQRPEHTIAQLGLDAFATFYREANSDGLTFEDHMSPLRIKQP